MNSITNLTVNYNAKDYSAVNLAKRLRASLGASSNFAMQAFEDKPCTSANGKHTPRDGGTVILAETCRTEGSKELFCTTCQTTYTENTPCHTPTFSALKEISKATCTSSAIYAKECTVCQYIEYSSQGSPTGIHTFNQDNVCTGCSHSKQELCKHTNLSAVQNFESGCGNGTKQTCLDCQKEFVNIVGENHSFSKFTVKVEPTSTTPGIKSRTCRSCGKVENALLYAEGDMASSEAVVTNADGSLSDVSVDSLKLSKVEREALNALLQDSAYGSEIKVSYSANGARTDMTYSIPLPPAYENMHNLKIVIKDDEGKLHTVDFKIEKGYIVFDF